MSRISRWIKDPFPGLSHLFGVLLSIAALFVLLNAAGGNLGHTVAFAIYGASLILLYLASGLCHSIHCSPRAAMWLDRFDYMAIYLLIAGTYTPLCLIALRGTWGWSILIVEWAMALAGITLVLTGRPRSNLPRTILYLSMSWLVVIAAAPLLRNIPSPAVWWLLAGGVVYSVGAVVFVLNRPHLWPGRFQAHDLWHCMVLAGSACHFIVMLSIAP